MRNAPQHFLKLITLQIILCLSVTNKSHAQCTTGCEESDPSEINALADLYCSTNGDNWTINTGWSEAINNGTDCDYCEWHGVTCNSNGRVEEINLADNNLSGTFPESI